MEGYLKQNNPQTSYLSSKLLMVQPTHFSTNYETLGDNSFMKLIPAIENPQVEALKEYNNFISNLNEKKVEVLQFLQPSEISKDAIFPNNWFSTHKNENLPEGLLIIYPILSPNRRLERTEEIIQILKKDYKNFVDLSYLENEGEFLESTGCLIFDHENITIYCGLSERASKKALQVFIENFNKYTKSPYELITFTAEDDKGIPFYHTNVVMSVIEKHIIIFLDSIKNLEERSQVEKSILGAKNKKVIELSEEEMMNFCANIISVKSSNPDSKTVLIISRTAYNNLSPDNKLIFETEYDLCINDISIIEQIGGGSARCMVAEIF